MPDETKTRSLPDISAKLSAPPKKSLFERQKAEAEAKRARERAETAAVYEDFVKSFDEDPQISSRLASETRASNVGSRGFGPGGGPAKRHFTSSGPRISGPGTLGPVPSLSRKRTYEGFPAAQRNRDSTHGILAFENSVSGAAGPTSAFRASDDEDERDTDAKEAERAAAKPTLYLASLPPTISQTAIKSLVSPMLAVDKVKILRPSGQTPTDRKSVAAIVTLANESAASDIDSAVSSLQNKYLGWGYYLSISRHLSSAALNSTLSMAVSASSTTSYPFGAKPVLQQYGGSLNRASPSGAHRSGFAPPNSFASPLARSGPALQVEVAAPTDLKQLKLIHKTLENLLNYGPEFEALLMTRPEVQREEKWAWIWDARSAGGVYYRWKLWDILTNAGLRGTRRRNQNPLAIFENGANWVPPKATLKFEYTTHLDEFVSDEDYNSSDEEQWDMEDDRRNAGVGPNDSFAANNDGLGYLNPLQKAKLTHLLARLPTTHAKLRRGDVARVTAFAIEHAGAGADEVVEMIVHNVISPFACSGVNSSREKDKEFVKIEGAEKSSNSQNPAEESLSSTKDKLDLSATKLVGLYIISDILSSSATSGVRHAWRYRQLFETSLKNHRVFEHLGRQDKDLSWGRLKAEKWKRSIGSLLHLWEGWCVFPQTSQEHFARVFEMPPLTEEEMLEERAKAEAERAAAAVFKAKSKWKMVEDDASAGKFDPSRVIKAGQPPVDMGVVSSADQNDEDVDDELMSDIDGVPMDDSDEESASEQHTEELYEPMEADEKDQQPGSLEEQTRTAKDDGGKRRKPRPKAVDMFADSDVE